jgi:hypothetical protein
MPDGSAMVTLAAQDAPGRPVRNLVTACRYVCQPDAQTGADLRQVPRDIAQLQSRGLPVGIGG